jgi:glucose-1-phosphate thymidylyltransferase
MKGIILAGGSGTRLHPSTMAISKQLLPVYNKPMIYYPLSTLMEASIRDILIISTPQDINRFEKLLGDGSLWGISIQYKIQESPDGLAQAFLLGEDFIGDDSCSLILGDNLFLGSSFLSSLENINSFNNGARIFAYQVQDPWRYGVIEFDSNFRALSIEEKPKKPKSKYAVTGLYFYDNNVIDIAKQIKPSARGELEITDINNIYLNQQQLTVELVGHDCAWLDTGTFDSLLEASSLVQTLEHRQGHLMGSPESVAFKNGWMTVEELLKQAHSLKKNSYGALLNQLVELN